MTHSSEPTRAFRADILEILLALSDGPIHGYGIVQAVARQTKGATELAPSLLYRRLHKLQEDGLVDDAGTEAGGRGKAKRLYALTPLGRRVLRAEAARLVDLANSDGLRRVLDAPGAT